eukprot:2183694-Rhodomonas_salina.2
MPWSRTDADVSGSQGCQCWMSRAAQAMSSAWPQNGLLTCTISPHGGSVPLESEQRTVTECPHLRFTTTSWEHCRLNDGGSERNFGPSMSISRAPIDR